MSCTKLQAVHCICIQTLIKVWQEKLSIELLAIFLLSGSVSEELQISTYLLWETYFNMIDYMVSLLVSTGILPEPL